MGFKPAEVRAMTPAETDLLVQGWNEAQAPQSKSPPAMSQGRLDELMRMYPDG